MKRLSYFFGIVYVAAISGMSMIFGNTPVFAATYSLSIATNPIDMEVLPAGNKATVSANGITVISTCPNGYTLNIQGPSDTTLYKDGSSSNSSVNGSNNYISASSGTKANPVSILGSRINTWGYTVDANATFNSNFIGLTSSTTELISSNAATSNSGDTVSVYYGVSVSMSRDAGTYTMANDGAITYQLVTSLDCTSYQVQFDSNGGTGTMSNQRITEDTPTNLVANAFTAPVDRPFFVGWNTVADGTGTYYANQAEVNNLTAVGNTIVLYAQWTDCQANMICYFDNSANSSSKMGRQSLTSTEITNGSATLWASNFQRSGYGFLGWSEKRDPVIGTDVIYGPMETLNNLDLSIKGLRLFAVWQEAAIEGNAGDGTRAGGLAGGPKYMQDWHGCSTLTPVSYDADTGEMVVSSNSIITLTDQRDNQTYAVARLADGNCWMVENLRLDAEYTRGSNNQSLAQGYNSSTTFGDFIGLADAENANFASSTNANSIYYSVTQSGTATIDIGAYLAGYRIPRYNNSNTANAQTDASSYSPKGNVYSYGNYYSWAASIASTDYYPYAGDSETISTSICPSGWAMPRGERSTGVLADGASDANNRVGSFSYLDRWMGGTGRSQYDAAGTVQSAKWRSFPNNFIYSGNIASQGYANRNVRGVYWSKNTNGEEISFINLLYESQLLPGDDTDHKYNGMTLRCIITP